MKFCWAVLLLLVGLAVPRASQAQVSAYGEFSATDLTNLVNTNILYGATAGVLYDGPTLFHHMLVSADIQGRFVFGDGEKFNGVNVGPRFSFPLKKRLFRVAPYGEFLVGFARFNGNAATQFFNGPLNNQTTDATMQINAGVAKQVSPRLDVVLDYSYSQYYAYGGQYNPKTGSAGIIYHFVKR